MVVILQKAKAQKRQIKIQNNEDSYKSTKAIAGKQPTREYSGVNSTVMSSAEMANPMHFTGDFDSNNNDKGSEVKIQAKRYFPSFSFAEEGSVVSKKLYNTSKQDRSAKTVGRITSSSLVGNIDVNNNVASNVRSTGNDFSNTGVTYSNIGSNHSKANNIRWRGNKVKRQERTEISDSISSSDSASVLLQTATFPLHSSQPRETTLLSSSERVNPLRERQLQPLPHIDGVIPPPAEFSENLGKKNGLKVKLSKSNFYLPFPFKCLATTWSFVYCSFSFTLTLYNADEKLKNQIFENGCLPNY